MGLMVWRWGSAGPSCPSPAVQSPFRTEVRGLGSAHQIKSRERPMPHRIGAITTQTTGLLSDDCTGVTLLVRKYFCRGVVMTEAPICLVRSGIKMTMVRLFWRAAE